MYYRVATHALQLNSTTFQDILQEFFGEPDYSLMLVMCYILAFTNILIHFNLAGKLLVG